MRKTFLLLSGLLIGIVFIFFGVLPDSKKNSANKGVVVIVNDHPIYQSDLDLALEALMMNKRNQITDEEKIIVLERLIDEQLLLQRGLELDLPQTEGMVRKTIVSEMLDKIIVEGIVSEVNDEKLVDFYSKNIEFFSRPSEVHIKRLFIEYGTEEEDEQRLDEVRGLLIAGEEFDVVKEKLGDPIIPVIPNVLLPIKKLKDYLEPTLVELIETLQPGQITTEIESTTGYSFIYMLSSIAGEGIPFNDVKEQVKTEYLRRNDEESVDQYMVWLKKRAKIKYFE